jgi:two-component system, NarL family, response regulator DevR
MKPPVAPAPIRVLLVDDHKVVRVGLRKLLEESTHISVVGDVGTISGAKDAVGELHPDVILLDIRLSDGYGTDACRQLKVMSPLSKVIFLTSYGDEATILQAAAAGAEGYLLKEIDGPDLELAIQKVAQGESSLHPSVTKVLLGSFAARKAAEPAGKGLNGLSVQEKRVLALVAEGKTNKEIADVLGLSEKTVRNYLSNIFSKFQLTRRSEAAAFYAKNS